MIQQNQTPATPQLADLLKLLKQEVLTQLNCVQVGTIQTFDSAKQTAKVSVNFKKVFFPSETGTPTYEDYPVLVDVPCVILNGGLASLQVPITPGDTCLLFFNDRNIDTWFVTGQTAAPPTARLHSMADAFALVGVRSMAKPIAPYDDTRMSMVYGTTVVGVGPVFVKIGNAAGTLGPILQTLIGALTALDTSLTVFSTALAAIPPATTVTGAIIKPPSLALGTAVAAVQVTITTVGTQLAGLLE